MKSVFKNEVAIISADEVNNALKSTDRQYVQGNLKKEQILPYVFNEDSEIGISDYKEFTHDDPHYHDVITETNYVVSGRVCVKILDSGEEYVVDAGGVFSFPPMVKHILKIQAGTRIIFFKTKSINDKRVLDIDTLGIEKWLENRDF